MPTGIPSKTQAAIRQGIKVTELIKLVQDNTLRKNGKPLHPQRLKQIQLLLNKALPYIKMQEITGQVDTNITFSWEIPKK